MSYYRIVLLFLVSLTLIFCASTQDKIRKERENSPEYQYNLGLYYLNDGNLKEAIQYFNRSISLQSDYYMAYHGLGLAYSMQRELEKSIEYFQKCLQINPNSSETRNVLGAIYHEMGFFDKAEQQYRLAIADLNYISREHPYYNLARLYMLKGDNDQAMENIDMALKLNRRMSLAHNLKGALLEKTGDIAKAIESYRNAARIAPDDHNIQFNLAVALYKNGNIEAARLILDKIYALSTDPDLKKQIEEYLLKIMEKKKS